MTTNSRYSVLRYITEKYGAGWVGTNDATQSDSTTFSDDSVFGGRTDAIPPIGADVRIRQNSAAAEAGTNTYYEARVSRTGSFSAGQLTFDPAPSLGETPVVANNVTEALVLRDNTLRWEDCCQYMNKALVELGWEKRIVPITMLLDGDMLLSTTTNWTGGGAETLAKNNATFAFPHRYLSVTGSTTSEYVRTTTTYTAEQSGSYYYEVCAAKATATDGAEVRLYDATNGSNFTLSDYLITERVPQIFVNNVTMASTTEQVQARITKADGGNATAILWVILRPNNARKFTIQDRPAKLLWLGELRRTITNDFEGRSWQNMRQVPAKPVQIGQGLWQYHVQESCAGQSLWYEEFIQPTEMDSDDDTTAIEVEDLAAVTAEMWLRPLAQKSPHWAANYEKAAVQAARVRQEYMTELRAMRQERQFRITPSRI